MLIRAEGSISTLFAAAEFQKECTDVCVGVFACTTAADARTAERMGERTQPCHDVVAPRCHLLGFFFPPPNECGSTQMFF